MKKGWRIISRFLPMLLISLILGGSLWSWNARRLGGDALPMPFGVGLSVVLSGSMEPALSVGDLLLIREADSYEVGDIIVYQSGSLAVVHRLTSLDGDRAVAKGDANNTADEPIPVTEIRGRVTAALPMIGYLILALKTPLGILLTLALAVLLLESGYRREKRRAADEQDKIREQILLLRRQMEEEKDRNQ